MSNSAYAVVMDSNNNTDPNGFRDFRNCVLTGEDVARYWGYEVPDFEAYGLQADKIYYVYRPLEEIKDSNFSNKPLLSQHVDFSATDYKSKFIAGTVGETEVVGDQLKALVAFWDKKALDQVDKGLKYLSCGYSYTPKIQSGIHNGQKYDIIMTDIIANHVAMVDNPRYKPAVVADGAFNINNLIKEIKKMSFLKNLKKLVMDTESMSFDEGIETVKSIMANDKMTADEKEEAIKELKGKVGDKAKDEEPEDNPSKKNKVEDNEPEEKKEKRTTMDADAIEAIIGKRVAEELAKHNKQSVVFDSAISDYKRLCGDINKSVFDSADAVYDKILSNHNIKAENKTLEQKQAMVEMIPNVKRTINKTVHDHSFSDNSSSLVPEHFAKLLKGN